MTFMGKITATDVYPTSDAYGEVSTVYTESCYSEADARAAARAIISLEEWWDGIRVEVLRHR